MLSVEQKRVLLNVAREALSECVRGTGQVSPDAAAAAMADPELAERRGVFVTLHRAGKLRGCIGYIEPLAPLAQAVARNAVNAAQRDSRFDPLRLGELAGVEVEISVLSPLELIDGVDAIVIGRDGLVVEMGEQRGVLLPQVATDHGLDAESFLRETCRKAGLPPDAWRNGARVWSFSAEVFSDPSLEVV